MLPLVLGAIARVAAGAAARGAATTTARTAATTAVRSAAAPSTSSRVLSGMQFGASFARGHGEGSGASSEPPEPLDSPQRSS